MHTIIENSDNLTLGEALKLSRYGVTLQLGIIDNGRGGFQWIEFDTIADARTWNNQK